MGRIPDDLRAIIADNIRKCRMKKFPGRGGGKKCAEAFGVSPQQWSPWECGKRTPDEERIEKIADFLGVSVPFLRQDHRHIPNHLFSLSPDTPADTQTPPSPNAGDFTPPFGTSPPFGEPPHDNLSSIFGDLPPIAAAPILEKPRPPGAEPPSGNDTYWLLAKFFSTVSNNGIIMRLTPQDMDYLGDCVALALLRRGVVFPPQR